MSAIAAIFNRDGAPVAKPDIERVGRAIKLFGSDFQRVTTEGECALACALTHYTPEAVGQSQPVFGGAGRFVMMFDGRIDNRAEIIEALGLNPAEAARMPDATLAMRSYERWGVESFTRWVADFALILWDSTGKQLMLARDPFGNRSLLYHDTPGRFVACTMPQGLHALPDIPIELDEQKLADSLVGLLNDPTRSFYKGIAMCPAAHYMIVSAGGIRAQRYYQFGDHVREVRFAKDEDYVEAARELFGKAVSARTRSAGRLGAFMSGGLDSSTGAVVAWAELAARGETLPVFTHVPVADWDGVIDARRYGDETPFVEMIVGQHPNLVPNFVRSGGKTHYAKQDEYLRLSGMPLRHAAGNNMFHSVLGAAQEQGMRVMLTGSLGNMTLSYDGEGLFYDLWKSGRFARLFRELKLQNPRARKMAQNFYHSVFSGIGSGAAWSFVERMRRGGKGAPRWHRTSVANHAFGEAMGVTERAADTAAGSAEFILPQGPNRRTWRRMAERAPGSGIAQWEPAMKALYGIEMRDPFGDRRLIEWCFGVPEDQFRRNGVSRWLIKRMMQGRLPDAVLAPRHQRGSVNADWHARMTPELDRMKADLAVMAEDADLARMIDIPRLQAMLDDWPEQAITDWHDDRRFYLPIRIPMALQVGRFVQLTKGSNF